MYRYLPIRRVYAREVLDSRANPTVEVEVTVGERLTGKEGYTASAIVPSGASTGKYEALELRDKEKRYLGKGVKKAVAHVNDELAEAILGENALNQKLIDGLLLAADGTEHKERLGANAVLGVSLAVAKAAALALQIPLYQYLGGCHARKMPIPMMNILNGGVHADNTVDFQEFMIMPVGASCFSAGLQMCAEIYHNLKSLLIEKKLSTGVGDEGGFAPDLKSAREVFQLLTEAIKKSGYQVGEEVMFAMDAAASELYDEKEEYYYFPGESEMTGERVIRKPEEMVAYYKSLCEEFPIVSIEDGLDENDWEGWKLLTSEIGDRVQLVGDDLFVTNEKRLRSGINLGAGNAILVKVNQIGSLSEAMSAIEMAQRNGYRAVISHRSGESEDTFIAQLAVAVNAGQIKTGAPARGERTAKYNELLRIEELLGEQAVYENPFTEYTKNC